MCPAADGTPPRRPFDLTACARVSVEPRRLVVPSSARLDGVFRVDGEVFHHATHVLRMRVGDRVLLLDGSGDEHECVISEVTAHAFLARIVETRPGTVSRRLRIRLCCALLKGDHLDLVLQKGTELGVTEFVFYHSERTVVRVAPADARTRTARWTRIVEGAVRQCRGLCVPAVSGPLEFGPMLALAANADLALIPWEGDGSMTLPRLRDVVALQAPSGSTGGEAEPLAVTRAQVVSLVIGPEGGFAAREIALARAAGLCPVTLGDRVLRAETAGVVVPALLLFLSSDLG